MDKMSRTKKNFYIALFVGIFGIFTITYTARTFKNASKKLANINIEDTKKSHIGYYIIDKGILELKKEVEDFKFKTQLLEDEKAIYKELIKDIQSLVKQD